jgi:hypothetical protein
MSTPAACCDTHSTRTPSLIDARYDRRDAIKRCRLQHPRARRRDYLRPTTARYPSVTRLNVPIAFCRGSAPRTAPDLHQALWVTWRAGWSSSCQAWPVVGVVREPHPDPERGRRQVACSYSASSRSWMSRRARPRPGRRPAGGQLVQAHIVGVVSGGECRPAHRQTLRRK